MPRLASARAGRAAAAALALLCLALPPDLTRGALAAAAASVFEAAPFVLAAPLLPARVAAFAPLLACGCGGRLPGALSLPAIGLCWLAFGPAVTLARTAAALGVALGPGRAAGRNPSPEARDCAEPTATRTDGLADLNDIGIVAFAGSLAAATLPAALHHLATPVAFLGGALVGALLPCASAGLIAAVGIGAASPAAAAGLVSAAGIVSIRPPALGHPQGSASPHRAAFALMLTAIACAWLTVCGGQGFLNPRLLALAPAGALAAVVALARGAAPTRLAAPLVLPLALLASLALGSPPPRESAATFPLGLYPGRAVDFTGTVRPGGRAVARAAILCCRADAQVFVLPLDRTLPFAVGSWVRVRGRIATAPGGLRLSEVRAETAPVPSDVFAYL